MAIWCRTTLFPSRVVISTAGPSIASRSGSSGLLGKSAAKVTPVGPGGILDKYGHPILGLNFYNGSLQRTLYPSGEQDDLGVKWPWKGKGPDISKGCGVAIAMYWVALGRRHRRRAQLVREPWFTRRAGSSRSGRGGTPGRVVRGGCDVSLLKIVGIYLPLALTVVLVVLIVRFKITPPARYAKAVRVAGWTASTVAFVVGGILIALHR